MKIRHQTKMYTCYISNILLANHWKKILIKFSVYFIFLSVAVLIALMPSIKNIGDNNKSHARYTSDLKYILFWHQQKRSKKNVHHKSIEFLPGQSQFIKHNCEYFNCYITYNKSLLYSEENFDAVVFNIHSIRKINADQIKLKRNADQIYIFRSLEPSDHHPICEESYDDFFNWTWTYKLNSDIPHPFIDIYDLKYNKCGPNTSIHWVKNMVHSDKYKANIASKTKAVAALVTNCKLKTKHQDLINDLKEELKGYNFTVDVFGPCSERKCPKGDLVKCFEIISKEYFFNLVLEDSSTQDFLTERMVRAMTYLSIPIVNGVTNYSYFLPPGSYINAKFFDVKKLGAVLDYLIKNPSKYSYFFDWKNYYYYSARPRSHVCDLCAKLNENNIRKSYKNIRSWWHTDFKNTCQRSNLYNLFKN